MRLRPTNVLAIFGGALALACVAGLLVVLLPLLPFQHQWARRRWEQQRPRHYELEVAWANGWNFGDVLVEVRDNRIVNGVDLDRRQPLDLDNLYSAGYFASIDNLFRLIDGQIRPSSNWRYQLSRYHPLLAHQLDPCAAPLPRVRYDAEYGYPTTIDYYDSSCIETDFNLSNVRIKQFHPLP